MKTNQILMRQMGEFHVLQRTKDGMFNATTLLKQWNEHTGSKKELKDFFDNKSTQEFINVLKNKENLNGDNSPYLATRGKNGGTWMHPFLFIDFAMWINPEFKYEVIKFVYDQLIKYRNDAGNAYKEVTSAITKITDKSFVPFAIQKVARAMNHIVFGVHESEIRNSQANEDRLRELFDLEIKVASLINEGFIKTFDQLIDYLRGLWTKKWQPKVLSTN